MIYEIKMIAIDNIFQPSYFPNDLYFRKKLKFNRLSKYVSKNNIINICNNDLINQLRKLSPFSSKKSRKNRIIITQKIKWSNFYFQIIKLPNFQIEISIFALPF